MGGREIFVMAKFSGQDIPDVLDTVQKNIRLLSLIPKAQKHMVDRADKKVTNGLSPNGAFNGNPADLEEALLITENELVRLLREHYDLEGRLQLSATCIRTLAIEAVPPRGHRVMQPSLVLSLDKT